MDMDMDIVWTTKATWLTRVQASIPRESKCQGPYRPIVPSHLLQTIEQYKLFTIIN